MSKEEGNYISLQEATQFCNYSQEYLSLRARQGKLKAVKFGRNWVTRKEWLDEYFQNVEEYNNNVKKVQKVKKLNLPPSGLPVEKMPVLRFGFVAALAFVLIITGVVSGKTSFQNFYDQASSLSTEFTENFDRGVASIEIPNPKLQIPKLGRVGDIIGESFSNVGSQTAEVGGMFGDYGQWISGQVSELTENAVFVYVATNDFLEDMLRSPGDVYNVANNFVESQIKEIAEGIKNIPGNVAKDYKVVNKLVEAGLQRAGRAIASPFVKAYNFVTAPFRGGFPGKLAVEEVSKEEFESLQKEVERMKEEGLPVKEVTQVTQIQPVTEVTKEITKIDDKSLQGIKLDIKDLQAEVAKRLYAPGGVISQQIYITEPVASPKIYQENGDIVLQTAGSGNVVLSAATGMQISGSQVIIDSTSVLNPLVYIADKLRIDGETEINAALVSQQITINVASDYTGNLLDAQVGGTSKFSLTEAGNATLVGNFTIGGNLTVAGAQTYSGAAAFTASSTSPALSVTQTGSGKIAEFTNTSSATSSAVTITNLGSGASFLVEDSTSTDSTPFVIDASGYVGIGTSTPAYPLHVVGTGPGLFYVEGNFTSGGTMFALKNATDTGDVAFDFYSGSGLIGNIGYITSDGKDRFIILQNNPSALDLAIQDGSVGSSQSYGNVVIGATSSSAKLHVVQSTSTDAFRVDDEFDDTTPFIIDDSGRVAIGTTTAEYSLHVWGDMAVGTSTTPVLYVDPSTERVGIATSSPSEALTVAGNILGSGNIVVQDTAATSTFYGGLYVSGSSALATTTVTGDFTVNIDDLYIQQSTGYVGIGTSSPASILSIYGTTTIMNGNVGIGTEIPTQKFHIDNGDILVEGAGSFDTADETARLYLGGTDDWVGTTYGGLAELTGWFGVRLMYGATPTEAMRITNTGKVSIGTTTDNFGLSLQASSTDGYFGVSNVNDGDIFVIDENGYVGIATSSPASALSVYGTTTIMNGYVGIGTESPGFNLDVVGQLSAGSANQFQIDAGGYISTSGGISVGSLVVSPSAGGIITTGIVGIGTSTPAFGLSLQASSTDGYFGVSNVNDGDIFVIDESGYVGIGTTAPSSKLDVIGVIRSTSVAGAPTSGTGIQMMYQTGDYGQIHAYDYTGAAYKDLRFGGDYMTIQAVTGNVGIGTTTPDALLHVYGSHATSTLTVDQTSTGNIVDLKYAGISALTLKSSDYLKYRAGLAQTWGTINDVVIDDFEDNDVANWTSSNTTDTKVSATTTYFRVNDYALAITSATGSSNGDTATTSPSTTDWSSYERLSFWIRADYTTTSTGATTTQIISVQLNDTASSTQTHNVTINQMSEWQYEEWNISQIAGRASINWVGFRIDIDDGSPTFYIDQIRLYDNDLQAGEMFVDSQGSLVIWGQKSVEIGRTVASNGALPSIKAGTAVVEFNQPISVNVGGDVGFDYDIYFANTGLSQITSAGPLAILAGDPNHAENLTLGTQGTGDVIVDIVNSTTTYGGFKIIGSDSGSYVVRISPDGDVYIGGTGEGGSDLWVKQNITQRGGELQIKPLDISEAGDLSATDNTTDAGVCTSTESILYRITALNDNGETTPSAIWAASTTKATSSVDVSWQPVEGATKYKLYRTTGYRLNDGETIWTAATTSVTVSATTTQVKVGTYSAGLSISTTTEVGLVATSTVGTSNLSLQSSIAFWIRSSIDVDRGDLKFVMDETADCLSPDESLSVPALSANTWKFVKLPFEQASTTRNAAACVGISLATDRGLQDIYIDEVLSSTDNSFFVDGAQISTASSTSYTDDCVGADDTAATPPTQNTTGGKIMVYRGNDYYGSEATTTAFGVDEAVVSIGYPLNVTTGGDVGIAYDLQFLNTGSTYITSAGPLWLQAGSPNKTQNLVLTVAGESGKDSGDVIVDVRYSNNTYGGFKIIGDDSGGYVFKVSPSGDVEVGGAGSGGSDLTVKQNLVLTGGNITINALATTTAPTLSTTTSGDTGATTYYYRITAANDNGQTTGSATNTITTNASEKVVVSWDGVTGATKHYIWRSTDDDWSDADDNYRIEVSAPSTAYQDTATDTQSTSTYPTSNTTGGGITYTADGTPKRTIVLTASGAITPTASSSAQTKVDGTNHTYYVLDYDPSADEYAYWQWTMPDSYDNGTIDVTYYWEAASTSGDVVWCFQSKGIAANNSENIDSALGTAVCETDTADADAHDIYSATESSAASNFVAGEYVTFKAYRDADNGSDTMGSDARLVKVKIEYAVSQESD